MSESKPVVPTITEDDIAQFLAATPSFFERHADLLGSVQLFSPHGRRAVSLQERQAEMLRDKIKLLEQRVMQMMSYGNENLLINDRLQRWVRQLFLVARAVDLPAVMVSELKAQFSVPQVALRLWEVAERYRDEPFAQGASDAARSLAASLTVPYCGVNVGFDAVQWLDEPDQVASLAMIALRAPSEGTPVFGLLLLASPDGERYRAGMATDVLERLGELASAALTRVRERE